MPLNSLHLAGETRRTVYETMRQAFVQTFLRTHLAREHWLQELKTFRSAEAVVEGLDRGTLLN